MGLRKLGDCVVCDGKYTALVLSTGCYAVPTCKKHTLEIIKILQEQKKREDKSR